MRCGIPEGAEFPCICNGVAVQTAGMVEQHPYRDRLVPGILHLEFRDIVCDRRIQPDQSLIYKMQHACCRSHLTARSNAEQRLSVQRHGLLTVMISRCAGNHDLPGIHNSKLKAVERVRKKAVCVFLHFLLHLPPVYRCADGFRICLRFGECFCRRCGILRCFCGSRFR